MHLRQLAIHSYRQFVDQVLELPERVTVLVGRNDAGKTGLVTRMIDQHLFELVIHGADRSRVAGPAGPAISFDAVWDVSPADYNVFPLRNAFGRDDANGISSNVVLKRRIGDESRVLLQAVFDHTRIEQAAVILPFPSAMGLFAHDRGKQALNQQHAHTPAFGDYRALFLRHRRLSTTITLYI